MGNCCYSESTDRLEASITRPLLGSTRNNSPNVTRNHETKDNTKDNDSSVRSVVHLLKEDLVSVPSAFGHCRPILSNTIVIPEIAEANPVYLNFWIDRTHCLKYSLTRCIYDRINGCVVVSVIQRSRSRSRSRGRKETEGQEEEEGQPFLIRMYLRGASPLGLLSLKTETQTNNKNDSGFSTRACISKSASIAIWNAEIKKDLLPAGSGDGSNIKIQSIQLVLFHYT